MNSLVFPAGLSAHKNYGDCSYIHSVLQCFLMHPLMKEINNSFNFNQLNNNRFRLTIEMLRLFNTINQRNIGNSSNIIDLYYKILGENRNILGNDNRFLLKDPYHFLYYFLHFLHLELNFSPGNFDLNSLINASYAIKKQENLILEIFARYLLAYHGDSLIFKYFLSSEKNKYLCKNCDVYYDFSINSIFRMDLPQIKRYKNNAQIVTLDDCFDCYCNDNNVCCQYCNSKIWEYKKIYNGKSLIIRFKRNSLGNSCDVNFPYTFDFSNYSGLTDDNINNKLYVLKSIISFMPFNNNSGKYFADINIDVNNNSGKWVRYIDSQVNVLNNPDYIKKYEPQILIYELKTLEQNNNFVNQINNFPPTPHFDPNLIVNPYGSNNNQMNMSFIQGNFMVDNNHNNQNNVNPMNNMNNNQLIQNMNFNSNQNLFNGGNNVNNDINNYGNFV
jgi:hypothetical protein